MGNSEIFLKNTTSLQRLQRQENQIERRMRNISNNFGRSNGIVQQ